MTALMVVIMTSLLAVFFLAVDSAFSTLVHHGCRSPGAGTPVGGASA